MRDVGCSWIGVIEMSYDPSKTIFMIDGLNFDGGSITPRILTVELRLKKESPILDLLSSRTHRRSSVALWNVPAYVAMDSMRRAIKNLTGVGEVTVVRDDGTILMDVSYEELEYY